MVRVELAIMRTRRSQLESHLLLNLLFSSHKGHPGQLENEIPDAGSVQPFGRSSAGVSSCTLRKPLARHRPILLPRLGSGYQLVQLPQVFPVSSHFRGPPAYSFRRSMFPLVFWTSFAGTCVVTPLKRGLGRPNGFLSTFFTSGFSFRRFS